MSLLHTPLFAFLLASAVNHPSFPANQTEVSRRDFRRTSGRTFNAWSVAAVETFGRSNSTRDDKAWALRQLWAVYQEVSATT